MGHHCCSKQKVRRGLWSPEEDEKLRNYITAAHGHHGCWSSVPQKTGLQRCGKSCRLRWINYLRPDVKRGCFSAEEERIIIDVHRILGNRWAQIAKHLPGRTDNEVKNFWNSCIKKKLIAQGLDPNTHNLLPNHRSSKQVILLPPHQYTISISHIDCTTNVASSSANTSTFTLSSPVNVSVPNAAFSVSHLENLFIDDTVPAVQLPANSSFGGQPNVSTSCSSSLLYLLPTSYDDSVRTSAAFDPYLIMQLQKLNEGSNNVSMVQQGAPVDQQYDEQIILQNSNAEIMGITNSSGNSAAPFDFDDQLDSGFLTCEMLFASGHGISLEQFPLDP